ncbi:YaaW family protein [Capilliphycus salinus ALCB114379]|uniref:YaaW family protein n=1 Tax=Capilliphycus salinus TaxID=2768948 RepID=UPI0039A4FA65
MDELRGALELATEEELQQLTELLFSRRFNPLDYFNTPQPIDIQSRDHEAWLDALEQRFRYLAADGLTVLRGRTHEVSYRHALIQVCRYLKISYSKALSTTDLEAEIFLFLLGRAWKHLPASEQEALTQRISDALAESNTPQPLPLSAEKNPLGFLFKAGSAIAVSTIVQPIVLKQLARQFALHFAKYQVAKQTIVQGGTTAATQLQSYVSVQMAKRGMAASAARYGATRSVFALLGPMLWTWFVADVGWKAISTNYARIIPTIFTLAQIRLTRSEWTWEPVV